MKSFNEYINAKKKVAAKPSDDLDYAGPQPKAPASSEYLKDSGATKAPGKPAPYANGTPEKLPDFDKGLGDRPAKGKSDGLGTAGSDRYAGLLDRIKNKGKDKGLANESTTQAINECACGCGGDAEETDTLPFVSAPAAGRFHPYAPEAIRYVVAIMKANPKMAERVVAEALKQKSLAPMLESIIDKGDCHGGLCDLIGHEEHGPRRAKSLVRAMNDAYSSFQSSAGLDEAVAPPVGFDAPEDGGSEDGESLEDDQAPEDTRHNDGGEPDNTDPFFDDEEGDAAPPPEEESGPEAPMPPEEGEDPAVDAPAPRRSPRRRFAHDHMLDAMSQYPQMKGRMRELSA